jgi:hypothetical protein
MKTTKLIVDYDYDFKVIGLITPVKGYRLAWLINKMLSTNLYKADDIVIDFLKEGKIVLINYIYETEYSIFRLIKNKSIEFTNIAKPFLLPELKEYDYLIQLNDESGIFDAFEMVKKLKEVQGVEFVKEIATEEIKSIDNLIF